MVIRVRCHCGKLQGELDTNAVAARAKCYCRDCRAFARYLGNEVERLDGAGGTEVAAALPSGLTFTQGLDQLACMSLGPKGIYRWYASCCNTPVGNTPRNAAIPYVGLVRACLDAPPALLDRQLGRARMTANRGSAHGPTSATPVATLLGVARIGGALVMARLSGSYRDNPFFDAFGAPVRTPRVLSREERAAVTR